MKYSILLVDDEEIVRNGLHTTINWENTDFEIVGEADDGTQALELCSRLNPHIIITDIRMAEMDGLSMIKQLNTNNINAEIVILTGYNEFNYAKTALENGVSAYLLKPVSPDDLLETLELLKIKIIKKEEMQSAMNICTSNKKERFLYDLLYKNIIYSEQIRENKQTFVLPKYEKFIVACLGIDNNAIFDEYNINRLSLRLKEIIEYNISIDVHYVLNCTINKAQHVMLIFTNSAHCDEDVTEILKKIKRDFETSTDETLTIGLSGIMNNLDRIENAYKQAQSALMQRPFFGNSKIIDYTRINNISTPTPVLTTSQMGQIVDAVKKFDEASAMEILHEYFYLLDRCDSINIIEVKNTILELSILIIKTTFSDINIMQKAFGRIVKPSIELHQIELLTDIKAWIINIVTTITTAPQIYFPDKYSPIVQQTITLIMQHYDLPLTIEWIAGKLFVSAGHLSRCFKQETGKKFTEYLTEYRMNIAIEMLKKGEYKIYEIAKLVGYQDIKYFYKLFKKHTGNGPKYYYKCKENIK